LLCLLLLWILGSLKTSNLHGRPDLYHLKKIKVVYFNNFF
jgi:hypothetical protein